MILKFIEELSSGDILAKEVLVNGSVYFGKEKEISDTVITKLKELNITHCYIKGDPEENQILRQYLFEIKNKIDNEITINEKIEFLIDKNVDVNDMMDIFNFIEKIDNKNIVIEYLSENYSSDVLNFFIKTMKMQGNVSLNIKIMDCIQEKITPNEVDMVIGLIDYKDVSVRKKARNILKKNHTLRELYLIKNRLEERGEKSDFFTKDINFLLMPPKMFWDKRIIIFSEDISKHKILKSYLNNLEMQVELKDYSQVAVSMDHFMPYIVIFDLDQNIESINIFKKTAKEYKDKIFFVLSTKVDKKLFWETTNYGASYFIKKPYSLPKIQKYLSIVLKHGKLIRSIKTSNGLLEIKIKNFGKKIKKIDFYGELIGFTVDEVVNEINEIVGNDKYYFCDLANLIKIDNAGIRFFMNLKDNLSKKYAQLFLLNCHEGINKELDVYKGQLEFAEAWEEEVWK